MTVGQIRRLQERRRLLRTVTDDPLFPRARRRREIREVNAHIALLERERRSV